MQLPLQHWLGRHRLQYTDLPDGREGETLFGSRIVHLQGHQRQLDEQLWVFKLLMQVRGWMER
jgi:hypothetical protein